MITEDNPNMKEVHVAYLKFISFLHTLFWLGFNLILTLWNVSTTYIIKEIDSLHLSHVYSRRFIKKNFGTYICLFEWWMWKEKHNIAHVSNSVLHVSDCVREQTKVCWATHNNLAVKEIRLWISVHKSSTHQFYFLSSLWLPSYNLFHSFTFSCLLTLPIPPKLVWTCQNRKLMAHVFHVGGTKNVNKGLMSLFYVH